MLSQKEEPVEEIRISLIVRRSLRSDPSSSYEVDVIADVGTKLMPIEIKAGQTLNRDFFTGLERWMALAGDQAISPTLVYFILRYLFKL